MKRSLFRRMAVHRKLMTMLMVTSGSALLMASLASVIYQFLQFRKEAALNLGTTAALLLENVKPAITFQDRADARDTLATLASNASVRMACVYETSGALFAEYHPDATEGPCPAAPPPPGYRFSTTRLELVQRDVSDGKPAEWLLLRTNLDLLLTQWRTQALITAGVFAAALALAFLLSSALQRVVSDPVVELADVARAVSMTGDYSRRAMKRTDDELGVLADSFNSMLERITRAETERERALDRERQANRAKDEFLATLSHELRTPLSGILGWTQLLQSGLVPPAEVGHALDRIERNARSQTRLIEDLLDISRILSGKLSLQRRPVDLVPIARAAADGMLALAQSRQLALSVVAEEPAALASVDADRISQVFSNLISNALKFTPAGGRVDVIVRRAGEMHEVVVSDTGMGIPPDFLPRVFEPFRQADASHSRPHGGLGLGLAIVHRIVEMHGGEVTAESAGEGRGTSFRVRLPAAVESQQPGHGDTGAVPRFTTPDLSGLTILVVDDDADTRELVMAALKPTRAAAVAVSNADDALAAARKVPPDVLVTDLAMPHVDGYTLKHRLETVLGDRMPPVVIALSAFAAEADVTRSMAHGFHAHLTKPFDAAVLLATIAERAGVGAGARTRTTDTGGIESAR